MSTIEHATLRSELQAVVPVSDRAAERLHSEGSDIAGDLVQQAVHLLTQFREKNQGYKHYSAEQLEERRAVAKRHRRAVAGLLRAAAAILEET